MPEGLENMTWYKPTPRGLEIKIGEKMKHLAELNREALASGRARVRKKS